MAQAQALGWNFVAVNLGTLTLWPRFPSTSVFLQVLGENEARLDEAIELNLPAL